MVSTLNLSHPFSDQIETAVAFCHALCLVVPTMTSNARSLPDIRPHFTKRLIVLLGKTVLGLLSVAGVLLLVLEGWLIWHFEYGIGLPAENRIAALPATGHLCLAEPDSRYVPLTAIPPLLKKAVLVSYDLEFYERLNAGVLIQFALAPDRRRPWSPISFAVSRTCLKMLVPACCEGQPSLDWQIGEILLIGRIERALSRDRILEAYLNDSYLGRSTYGVEAAAKIYFGKTLSALDIDEIAFLVAHFGRSDLTGRRAKDRRDFTIDRMRTAGLIDEQQAATAKSAPLPWLDNQPRDL
jgi:penicillin-binding protein 1A